MQIICIQAFSSPELSGLYVVDQEENHFLKGRGYEHYRVFPHPSYPITPMKEDKRNSKFIPDPVCPYAMSVPLNPFKAAFTRGLLMVLHTLETSF